MNYNFRRIEANDIDSIWLLIKKLKAEKAEMSFTDYSNKEEVRELINNPAKLSYVALENERIISLVVGKRSMNDGRSHAVFLSAATHPKYRGLGIVGNLTNFALNEMKKEGVNIARIYVYSNNKASINSVKKLGFVHAGTVLRHHKDLNTGGYVNDVIFHKILDE